MAGQRWGGHMNEPPILYNGPARGQCMRIGGEGKKGDSATLYGKGRQPAALQMFWITISISPASMAKDQGLWEF